MVTSSKGIGPVRPRFSLFAVWIVSFRLCKSATIYEGAPAVFACSKPPEISTTHSDVALILSHVHTDHAGGLAACFDRNLTAAMSLESAQTLRGQGNLDVATLRRTLVLRADELLQLGHGVVEDPVAGGTLGYLVGVSHPRLRPIYP